MRTDEIGVMQDKLQKQITINNCLSKRIGIILSEKEELKHEYIEGQNNLIIYLRERVHQMIHEGKDFGDVVSFIQTVKPIFKHD